MNEQQTQEAHRLALQARLDDAKTAEARNKLGQFATPTMLADDIMTYARLLLPEGVPVRFLDPAFGTGSFFSALRCTFPQDRIASVRAFEVDRHYGVPAQTLWADSPLDLRLEDFTCARPPACEEEKPNLIICNPPYVRHHHLSADDKARLHTNARRVGGVSLSKLAGLYCYFLLLAHAWLAQGGVAGWLIPSEFMDVNYGRRLKQYLMHHVTLIRIHRFEPTDVQFTDALVSSAVVWFRNTLPSPDHVVEFTYGGTLAAPHKARRIPVAVLEHTPKWTVLPEGEIRETATEREPRLADLFTIKRGLATGDNKFFILTPDQVANHSLPREFLTPILPSPRYLPEDVIRAGAGGVPLIARKLYLLACDLPEADVRKCYPALWRYLQTGVEAGVHTSYLCSHRTPWYSQERRPAAPFLCTYMGRTTAQDSRPFRFILNHSQATAANTYHLLYPKKPVAAVLASDPVKRHAVWQALNAIAPEVMIGGGRVYGGGLHKVEPRELGSLPAYSVIAALLSADGGSHSHSAHEVGLPMQLRLMEQSNANSYYTLPLE